jgi:hypothetical protein
MSSISTAIRDSRRTGRATHCPVTGWFPQFDMRGAVSGTFAPSQFVVLDGALVALGLLRAAARQDDGRSGATVTRTVCIPVEETALRETSDTTGCTAAVAFAAFETMLFGRHVRMEAFALTIAAQGTLQELAPGVPPYDVARWLTAQLRCAEAAEVLVLPSPDER